MISPAARSLSTPLPEAPPGSYSPPPTIQLSTPSTRTSVEAQAVPPATPQPKPIAVALAGHLTQLHTHDHPATILAATPKRLPPPGPYPTTKYFRPAFRGGMPDGLGLEH